MSFVRYKPDGNNLYAYEVTAYWDKDLKKSRQKSVYMGVVDKESGIVQKKKDLNIKASGKQSENQILDFGDTYLVNEIMNKDEVKPLFEEVFKDKYDTLMALINFRLKNFSSMKYANIWYDGNVAKLLYPDAKISSQNISEFLKYLGSETLQRKFFERYLSQVCNEQTGILIDSTGLPNEIDFPLCAWGHHNGGIEKETRLILVVDKDTKMPLYFRYVAGNVPDVITLDTTIAEISKVGIKTSFAIIDAGYFCEDNIKDLYNSSISFITRLPAGRVLYKSLVSENHSDLEQKQYAIKYGKRGLFIKEVAVDLYGNTGFAYIVLDPERKGKELSKCALNSAEDGSDLDSKNCGIMILVSNKQIHTDEIIPLYYTRQMAERLFGISKDDLNILPLRIHSVDTFRGFMFLIFLSLIVYLKVKNLLGKNITIDDALLAMQNLKCKSYDDGIIISEMTKQQRLICEACGVIVSNKLGV